MLTDTCVNCDHWSADLPTLANSAKKPDGADPRVGVCQLYPPEIVRAAGIWLSLFPEVHANRTCGEWSPSFDPNGPERAEIDPEPDANVVPFERAAA